MRGNIQILERHQRGEDVWIQLIDVIQRQVSVARRGDERRKRASTDSVCSCERPSNVPGSIDTIAFRPRSLQHASTPTNTWPMRSHSRSSDSDTREVRFWIERSIRLIELKPKFLHGGRAGGRAGGRGIIGVRRNGRQPQLTGQTTRADSRTLASSSTNYTEHCCSRHTTSSQCRPQIRQASNRHRGEVGQS